MHFLVKLHFIADFTVFCTSCTYVLCRCIVLKEMSVVIDRNYLGSIFKESMYLLEKFMAMTDTHFGCRFENHVSIINMNYLFLIVQILIQNWWYMSYLFRSLERSVYVRSFVKLIRQGQLKFWPVHSYNVT